MLCKEVITVCYQVHTRLKNNQCGQNVDFLDAKIRGTCCNSWSV